MVQLSNQEFIALLRWVRPVEMESVLPPDAAMERLRTQTQPFSDWGLAAVFGRDVPLTGVLGSHRGWVRKRDSILRFSACRRLIFHLEPDGSGTRLHGTLSLRPTLLLYELGALIAMFALQGWMIHLWLASGGPISGRGILQILQQFGLIPFCALYIKICIWFGRKAEAQTLALVHQALQPAPSTTPAAPRIVSPPTATEVFIRPKHRTIE